MLEFARPLFFWLLLPLLAGWFMLHKRMNDPAALRHPYLPLFVGVRNNWRVRMSTILPWLNLFALILMVIAMAGPRENYDSRQVDGEGIDIILALDISGSMQALDFRRCRTGS